MKVAILADIHGNLPALRTVIDPIHMWSRLHEDAVLAGRISMAESVRAYLASTD